MPHQPAVEVVTLLASETVLFVLVYLFLVLEHPVAIFAVLGALLASGVLLARWEWLAAGIPRALARHRRLGVLYAIVFVLVLPALLREKPYQVFILFNAGLFALLALGLNWQLGSTNIVNFASAASFATGAYTVGLGAVHAGWSFWVLLPLAGLAAAAIGFVLGLPCMKTKTYYLSLVTMAFTLIVYLLLNNIDAVGGPDGINGIPFPQVGTHSLGDPLRILGLTLPFQANFYYLVLMLIALTFVVDHRFRYSPLGLAWNAVRDDEIAAAHQGINVAWVKVLSFCANFFFDGIAGAVFAASMGHVSPESFSFNVSVTVVAIVIVGGLDNAAGVVLGALLMTVIPEKFQVLQDYRMLIFGLIVLLMLRLRPCGLFPQTMRSYGASGAGR